MAGGLKLDDPGGELAAALAVASSLRDRPLPPGLVVLGELGLGGEVRTTAHLDARLREAVHMGFTSAMIPAGTKTKSVKGMEIREAPDLWSALQLLA